MFLEDGSSLDAATDMISSYINFCTDMYLETKEVKLHQNSKPWATKELTVMLNDRQQAFKEKNEKRVKEIQ